MAEWTERTLQRSHCNSFVSFIYGKVWWSFFVSYFIFILHKRKSVSVMWMRHEMVRMDFYILMVVNRPCLCVWFVHDFNEATLFVRVQRTIYLFFSFAESAKEKRKRKIENMIIPIHNNSFTLFLPLLHSPSTIVFSVLLLFFFYHHRDEKRDWEQWN